LDDNFISHYDQYLWKNGYSKFWNDLTNKEKDFCICLANSINATKEEIIKQGFSPSNYSQYRRRLLEKGLITQAKYNKLSFVLPRFDIFVNFAKEFI